MAPPQRNFKHYQSELRSVLSDEHWKRFKSLRTSKEKLLFVNEFTTANERCLMFPIQVLEEGAGKDSEKAKHCKQSGNEHFLKQNYNEACWFYSQAILKCPQNTAQHIQELSVYFANRSASLYHMKEYTLALGDMDMAFSIKYPRQLEYKLWDRKARCHLALRELNAAVEAFQRAIGMLDEAAAAANISASKKAKWQTDFQIMIALLLKEIANPLSIAAAADHSAADEEIISHANVNPVYKALTSDVKIAHSKEMGRFAVAKTNIEAGKIILIEESHCAVLLQKYQYSNCYHCFKRVKVVYPCSTCDQVIFCSEKCAKSASHSHHKFECPILFTIWRSEISITCYMALRIITQNRLEYFLDYNHRRLIEAQDKDKDKKKMMMMNSDNYETIVNLVSHEEKRKAEDMLSRTHVALFLLCCLKKAGYFKKDDEEEGSHQPFSQDELFIGGLMLHHLQILQFNAHEVSELHVDKDTGNHSSEFIGGALYPTLALFNHSCNPAIVRYFKKTKVITRAIRNIKAGEMIGENYGPLFTQTMAEERQRTLNQQYWFTCTCEACSDKWPTLSQMLSEEKCIRFRCSNKKCESRSPIIVNVNVDEDTRIVAACKACSRKCNIFEVLKLLQETDSKFKVAENLRRANKVDEALEIFLTILNLLEEHLVPPFKDYYICQQAIRTCYLMKGNQNLIDSKRCIVL